MRCITSQTVWRVLVFGFHSFDNSSRLSRRTLPAFASKNPALTRLSMATFLAFESVSARPYGPSFMAYSSNQAMAQRVSASYSPSCSARSDAGLGEVHRGNAAMLQVLERIG